MADVLQKYKINPVPRESLLQQINQVINSDCERIDWLTLPKATRIKPPPQSVAVVVDVTESQGAIHVTKDDGAYIDMVGTEFAGNLVVIPWDIGWCLRRSGSIEVGYVMRE